MKTQLNPNLETCIAILKSGGLLAMPTETVYGLFADSMNVDAVTRLFKLKGRAFDHPLNLNVSSYEQVEAFSQNRPVYLRELMARFLPGPLTVILEANDRVPTYINAGRKTVGFRMPSVSQTLEVIDAVGPLVGPSANLTGYPSPTSAQAVLESFDGQIEGLVCADQLLGGRDSTILDLTGSRPRILRQGTISMTDIRTVMTLEGARPEDL